MELKPCPFCGGEAYVDVFMDMEYIAVAHKPMCFVRPNTWGVANAPLKVQIKAWNRRVKEG